MNWAEIGEALLLDRAAVAAGQWWRLWSGHLMHLDTHHALVNLCALALLALIAWRMRVLARLALASLWLMPLISLALLAALPHLQWYAGLSGLLHAWAAWLLVQAGGRVALVGGLILLVKLCWEVRDVVPADVMPVIYPAHQIGALAGFCGAVLTSAWRRRRRPPPTP